MAGNGPSVHHARRPRLNHSRSGRGSDAARPPPETAATLPHGSAVAKVLVEIDELFGDSGEARIVTLLFRGNAITLDGLSQMDTLIGELVSDPSVGPILAPGNPVIAPSFLVKFMLQAESLESVTQADIDSARGPPELGQAIAAMIGTDTDGTAVAVATIRLRDTGDERIENAERRINELAAADDGPLRLISVSTVVVEDEYKRATEEGMLPLIRLSFLLIAALILLFMRSISDLLLTLAGLLMSIIWIAGAEGWLGPTPWALLDLQTRLL